MGRSWEGIAVSPGIVIGPLRVFHWSVPRVPQGGSVAADEVEAEIASFREACAAARLRIEELRARTERRIGPIEAGIFDPQLLMLEDVDLVGGTEAYIRDNLLSAARAFEWRVLEWESQWSHTAHPMVADKLNDLADVQARVLRHLLDLSDPDLDSIPAGERVVLAARDLTPSLASQLDPERVLGIATDLGTRTSHSAILARSLDIPAVANLKDLSELVKGGEEVILDGRTGRVVVEPEESEKKSARERDFQAREWEQELILLAHLDSRTSDGVEVALLANIDLPGEAEAARSHGAGGIGLFRTEFLVVGRSTTPVEEDQYEAFRKVLDVFPDAPVVIRTYDLGGDKFPAFLHMPREDNPFLGWRAIRVCLDQPDLFRTQLRAILRAAGHGDVRLMLPLVNEPREIEETRRLLDQVATGLRAEGVEVRGDIPLGAMIETPAAAATARELARQVDFFSVGTNDLVQYTLAVDRGNSRLAKLYNPFHPAVVRFLDQIVNAGRDAGIEVSVCGELAADPLGAFLLIGMGVDTLSVGPSSLAEIKKVIRAVSSAGAAEAARQAVAAASSKEVVEVLRGRLPEEVDLSLFAGSYLSGSG
ncbi:MAG: phosphoenolpyruvate--protein phosphotransferase [Longimicrobiaceae bacterium]